jgi:hypothetical protein
MTIRGIYLDALVEMMRANAEYIDDPRLVNVEWYAELFYLRCVAWSKIFRTEGTVPCEDIDDLMQMRLAGSSVPLSYKAELLFIRILSQIFLCTLWARFAKSRQAQRRKPLANR